jgi:hypothetical protein
MNSNYVTNNNWYVIFTCQQFRARL